MQKKILWAILSIFVIGGILLTISVYHGKNQRVVVDRHLTSEQQKVYKDKISKSQDALKNLNKSTASYSIEAANLHLDIGQLYFGLGRLSDSLDELERALALDKKNYNIYVSKSLAQTEMKDYAGAQTTLEEVLKITPRIADVWIRLIDIHKTRGDSVEDIKKVYAEALKKTDRHVDILSSMAQYEEGLGNKKEALLLWQEAVRQYPENSGYMDEVIRLSK